MINVKEYAEALFLLTEECGTTDEALADVKTVNLLLSEYPDYKNLLDTPALSKSERLALIDEAFGKIGEHTRNLFKILAERHGVHCFPKLAEAFFEYYDTSRGIIRADILSAVPLSERQTEALTEKLEKITGKSVTLTNTVDKSLIGGVKLRYGGVQLDSSLKTRLESFERSLLGTVV